MRIGIIAPISMLERYCTTRTQYCLPGLIVGNPIYRDFYRRKSEEGKVVIMDLKKASWKREPEEWSVVMEALKLVQPNIILLPSYTYDRQKTVTVANQYLSRLPRKNYQIFPCLEGTSKEDIRKCEVQLKGTNRNLWFALPSYLLNIADHKGRTMVYIENHLNVGELDGCGDAILVTSLPVRLGFEGRLLNDYRPSPPSLTFLEMEDKFTKVTERNIRSLIEYYETT